MHDVLLVYQSWTYAVKEAQHMSRAGKNRAEAKAAHHFPAKKITKICFSFKILSQS
jgi:hypothetical protein